MGNLKKNIILVGGGGHCKSCIDVIESTGLYTILGILDVPTEFGKSILDYKVIGNDDDYLKYKNLDYSFLITVGHIKSAALREKLFNKLVAIEAKIETVISPFAKVSRHSKIGRGTIVMHNSVINADANIGENNIINTSAVVEHDTKIGNHCHISTSATINGDCNLKNHIFVGSNTCISNGVEIGSEIIIGAGSTVLKNLTSKGIYVGTPAKKIAE